MIGYDIYDCFTMEHFRLRQRMTLTTKIYCSRLTYVLSIILFKQFSPDNLRKKITLEDTQDYFWRTFQLTYQTPPKINLVLRSSSWKMADHNKFYV
jgi:hypothetical protein